jgi:hypothetical protein
VSFGTNETLGEDVRSLGRHVRGVAAKGEK